MVKIIAQLSAVSTVGLWIAAIWVNSNELSDKLGYTGCLIFEVAIITGIVAILTID